MNVFDLQLPISNDSLNSRYFYGYVFCGQVNAIITKSRMTSSNVYVIYTECETVLHRTFPKKNKQTHELNFETSNEGKIASSQLASLLKQRIHTSKVVLGNFGAITNS